MQQVQFVLGLQQVLEHPLEGGQGVLHHQRGGGGRGGRGGGGCKMGGRAGERGCLRARLREAVLVLLPQRASSHLACIHSHDDVAVSTAGASMSHRSLGRRRRGRQRPPRVAGRFGGGGGGRSAGPAGRHLTARNTRSSSWLCE